MNNAQTITLAIIIALISSIATYSWNNQTLSEQVEEHNIKVLENCLSKARSKTTSNEILRATKNCNENILTKIKEPITWTASTTPLSSVPLWFQLIPSANANATDAEESGKQEVQATQSNIQQEYVENVSKIRMNCNANCKIKALIDIWINKNLSKEIVNVCKELAKNPVHCIKYASSVSSAESGWWKKCYKNNCFWIKAWSVWYKNLNDWVIDWVTRYNKYWWKATSMNQFYAPKGKLPYFRYCTSEHSSLSKVWCPFWLQHSSSTFNKLNKLF